MNRAAVVQTGLVPAGPLRDDFRRFLDLLTELDPRVRLREEPFLVLAELGDLVLCACRPGARVVHVRLGPPGGGEVGCRSHEDFVDILARLLAERRQAAGTGPAA